MNSTGDGSSSRPEATASGPFSLDGRVALVTGASRGIGEAIARSLAGSGAKVVLASRRQEALDAVAETIRRAGGEALPLTAHTGRGDEVARLVERGVEAYGGIDILINNAATNPHFGPIMESEEGHWDKIFEVNVKGYFHAARACAGSMRERGGGKIVNIASIAGIRPMQGLGIYSISKAAVVMMTKVLAAELSADNIQVNAIAPGLIQTRFSEALWKDPRVMKRVERKIPAGRLGQPQDLSALALFLSAPASDYTTGAVFMVDGGTGIGQV